MNKPLTMLRVLFAGLVVALGLLVAAPGAMAQSYPTPTTNGGSGVSGNGNQVLPSSSSRETAVLGSTATRNSLAFTGAETAALAIVGISLVAGGAAIVTVTRRRGATAA